MFVMGNGNITDAIREESATYKDIVFLDCLDGYNDLSPKVINSCIFIFFRFLFFFFFSPFLYIKIKIGLQRV